MADQHSKLLSLQQGGASVKEFAHQFLFVAKGLNISDAVLKDIFNNSLNEVYNCGEEGSLPRLGPPPFPSQTAKFPVL